MIDQNVLLRSDALSATFQFAKPFKYLCIDNFFNIDAAEQLLSDFPVFDSNKALNEFGEVGRKAVHTALSNIGPFYATVYDYLLSEAFLRAMSALQVFQIYCLIPGCTVAARTRTPMVRRWIRMSISIMTKITGIIGD